MKCHVFILGSLLVGTSVLAAQPLRKQPQLALSTPINWKETAPKHRIKQRTRPCQGQSPDRKVGPQGTLLWGTTRQVTADETSSLLSSVELEGVHWSSTVVKRMGIKEGRLVVPGLGSKALVGMVLQGLASDGQSLEVALCTAEPDSRDASMEWYRIEVWNKEAATWENPCTATYRVPQPRALAVSGVWDQHGAHQDIVGKFTFACENGAIAKCIDWGYKPWGKKDGRSLKDLHQACTRMARADYCGTGQSNTRDGSFIDMYDVLGILTRTTVATVDWQPEQASFEAAWTPEGAACFSRTRDGQAVETVLAQCPSRFEAAEENLGQGDHCTMRRKGSLPDRALLRNRSYGGQ